MNVTYFRNFKTRPHSDEKKRWQRTVPQGEIRGFIENPSAGLSERSDEPVLSTVSDKRSAFGYIFHNGPQTLTVTVPGDVVPVKFSAHTVLSGVCYEDESPDIVVKQAGVYEISYLVSVQAAKAVYSTFSIQANGQTIDGSLTARLVHSQETIYSAHVLADLKAETTIRLVMTSGTVVSVELSGGGVSASMMIKKLD